MLFIHKGLPVSFLLLFMIMGAFSACGSKTPAEGESVGAENLVFSGGKSGWPAYLNEDFRFPQGEIVTATALQDGQGGLIVLDSTRPSARVHEYYTELVSALKWQVLLKTFRPSEGAELLKKHPELAKKAGLEGSESALPGNNYIIIAEGKTLPLKEKVTVTVSILSKVEGSEIRLYFRKVPQGVTVFDMK